MSSALLKRLFHRARRLGQRESGARTAAASCLLSVTSVTCVPLPPRDRHRRRSLFRGRLRGRALEVRVFALLDSYPPLAGGNLFVDFAILPCSATLDISAICLA